MISTIAVWGAGLALAVSGDCTQSRQNPPALQTSPVASHDGCQIVDADQLASFGKIEFVDVRAQRGAQQLERVRPLSLIQLADRPPEADVTRVLLGIGLDDQSIAQSCSSAVARVSVVLRGGVRAWSSDLPHQTDQAFELQRALSGVNVAETLSSPVVLVVDRERNPSLAGLLGSAGIASVDVRELTGHVSEPLVFVDEDHWLDRFDQQSRPLSFYLQDGPDALVQGLVRARPIESSASVALVRPCYFP